MLLGATKDLSETRNFSGTVHFIFQLAEEMVGSGRLMVEEGFSKKFDVAGVYTMWIWPTCSPEN